MENENLSEFEIKLEKIKKLDSMGEKTYKAKFNKTHEIHDLEKYELGTKVSVAGRMTFKRTFGKLIFAKLYAIGDNFDYNPSEPMRTSVQISLSLNVVGEESLAKFKEFCDIGDFIGATGELIRTQTGELTVQVESFELLSKALRGLPEKFHGLVDMDTRYRQRYLDIISNEKSREVFIARSRAVSFVRRYLEDNGFIEVETPILQTAVSGASAKPFFTHHNALNLDCNLRIATETWLKMAVAGGFDKVFELGKDFRNEGMDPTHLQEFTQVEWYASYWDFEDNVRFFKQFIKELMMYTIGTTKINVAGNEIDFGDENWERVNYVEKMRELLGFDFLEIEDYTVLADKIAESGKLTREELEGYNSCRALIDYAYKKLIRRHIVGPTILYNYPAFLKTLARRNDDDSRVTDVFQVVVNGAEILNAYSELVDPIEQRKALVSQLKDKEMGDDETMDVDEDFLLAMEHGMPPMSGLGFGIDRFIMMIYDLPNIRDTILFPMTKPIDQDKVENNEN
ncbi:MAG: lysine--tRNA ligase [Clostridia bacterium]|nr:lysine--tRNA ligase [Clostridia bacterium]